MCSYIALVLLVTCVELCSGVELVRVRVEQGWLEGQRLRLSTGAGHYCSYKGVPYAAPPLGTLRFKAPQPPSIWTGIRNATKHGSKCVQQFTFTDKTVVGNEDCLFLNVYTPNIKPKTLLPVMLYIHGGGFVTESGNDDKYGPDFLVSCGVILVTINYRLGPLGFLAANTKEVPGNAGQLDQIAAMRWVKRNIINFGGNPDCVTIFGQSAGGASVSLHIVSPAAKGLFQRAIVMSSVYQHNWAMNFEPDRHAFTLCSLLGIDTNDPNKCIDFLQDVPPEKLFGAQPNIALSDKAKVDLLIDTYFTPHVEKKFGNGDSQYLTEHPTTLMFMNQINQVDLLIGHTAKEGLARTETAEKYILKYYPQYKQLLVPGKISNYRSFKKVFELADRIQKFYFGNKSISYETIDKFVEFYTYFLFVYDIHAFIEQLPKSPDTKKFFYEFAIYSSRNIYSKPGAMRYGIKQATHADDLPYLFSGTFYNQTVNMNSKEYKYIQLMCKLYTNFAKYGTPTPDNSLDFIWPEYDPGRMAVEIGRTGELTASPVSYATNGSVGFWHQLYSSIGMNY